MIYFPQIKTTNAELTAFSHLSCKDDDKKVIPVLQLTKPRLHPKVDALQSLENHIKNIFTKYIGGQRKAIVSITDDPTYQDAFLNSYIHDSSQGYALWRNRIIQITAEYNSKIIPSIVGKANQDTLEDLKLQIKTLLGLFGSISMRLPVQENDSLDNLKIFLDALDLTNSLKKEGRVYLVLDFGYITQSKKDILLNNLQKVDTLLVSEGWNCTCIPIFSSCPSSFTTGVRKSYTPNQIPILEYQVLEAVLASNKLNYGDYALIHPERKDTGGYWMPRIDYPTQDNGGTCYYMRAFNRETSRVNGKLKIKTTIPNDKSYINIAKALTKEHFYNDNHIDCWGKSVLDANAQLNEDELDNISGKAPQHYIAIRSNIHMERILLLMKDT